MMWEAFVTVNALPTRKVHRRRSWVCTTAPSPPPVKSTASAPEIISHPGYYVVKPPHLLDFLPHLESNPSPLLSKRGRESFVNDESVVLDNVIANSDTPAVRAFTRAGPRERVYFRPGFRAAIVSCGGICPGINTVIQKLTTCLHNYQVGKVFGVPHGYHGFNGENWREITLDDVEGIHKLGGTILGSSRGGFDLHAIVDAVETRAIDQLYVIGGDGTIRGVQKIHHAIASRRLKTTVVSVPKTIDNDIPIITRSFGFETAVEEAQRAIDAAYVEAESFPNCVSIVQLMGRNSGFIAMHAALASSEVDVCLIPEDPFNIRGPGGVLEHIMSVLDNRGRCVVVIAEGAGYEYVCKDNDIGRHLLGELKLYANEIGRSVSTKYLDPTYQIRALPTIASDNIFCTLLAHSAVHGAMAGWTGMSVGPVNGRNAYIPIDVISGYQKKVDTSERTWQRLVTSTGQPDWRYEEPDDEVCPT